MENGKTSSIHTSRAYGYHLVDWFSYAEKIGLDWKRASHRHLATYRNALAQDCSVLTKRPIKRETINLRVGMICMFYKFLVRHHYIPKLPFEVQDVRGYRPRDDDEMTHLRGSINKRDANPLMYRTYERSIEIPNNDDVRRFINSFENWRNKLIAETMWVSGIRRSEVCQLSVFIVPENLDSMDSDVCTIRIVGKGSKSRTVKLPVRLLRSIKRYVDTDRRRQLTKSNVKTDQIWISRNGKPIQPSAINKFFAAHGHQCHIKITPHHLRHNFAVNRLAYLQDRKIKSAIKILQGELGHSHQRTTEIYLHETDAMRAEAIAEHSGFIAALGSMGD